ncbi:MAG: squalene synthase HpnD [Spiribacter salinus]|uniref:Squalene synthase HpnD n=1 Tax=Spiribacter salinus TaxID=1335746 RepID=A0A540VVP9_9GAMM|nr:squalene/phytoene synthase family protein [Spiribacter sp.]MDR9454118.1 squalene/phytoene synthase family protein [Spiribacter sp.]TQF00224.1 MAG: squalene synthase HpnD [Spiribacter salinus]
MDPLDYCRQKVAPDGSSVYYALLFAPNEARAGLTALAAYRAEILEIPREVSEAGVGAVKLTWWQEELERLQNGAPRHPVTQALLPSAQSHGLNLEGLGEVIEAARMDLEYGRYPTLRELTLYCHRAGGAIADLAWRLTGARGDEVAPFAHDLSMGLELTRMIRHVRRDVRAGRVYIPEDELTLAGLDTETLLDEHPSQARQELMERQGARARRFLDSAIAQLPGDARRGQTHGLVLAVLYRRLLDTLAHEGYPVVAREHHLTPLRKFWLAWRTARRPGAVKPGPGEIPK